MIVLALSSSSPIPSAALCLDGQILGHKEGAPGRTHAETLLPLTDALLCECEVDVRDIDFFCADTGPGSFTGVRIGVCAVNAMAAAMQKGVYGISALEALCYGHSGPVCALIDARNGNAYAALYENGRCLLPPGAVEVKAFAPSLPPGTLFTGDGAQIHRETLASLVSRASFAPGEALAATFALLAFARLGREAAQKEVYPLYLRPSQAERLFKEKH